MDEGKKQLGFLDTVWCLDGLIFFSSVDESHCSSLLYSCHLEDGVEGEVSRKTDSSHFCLNVTATSWCN